MIPLLLLIPSTDEPCSQNKLAPIKNEANYECFRLNSIKLRLALVFIVFIFPLLSSCKPAGLQNANPKSIFFTLQDGNQGEIWALPLAKDIEPKVLDRFTPAHTDFISAKTANLMTNASWMNSNQDWTQ